MTANRSGLLPSAQPADKTLLTRFLEKSNIHSQRLLPSVGLAFAHVTRYRVLASASGLTNRRPTRWQDILRVRAARIVKENRAQNLKRLGFKRSLG